MAKRPKVARAAKACAGRTKGTFKKCVKAYMKRH